MPLGKSAHMLLNQADNLLFAMVQNPPRHYRVAGDAAVNLEKLAELKKEFTVFYLAFLDLAPKQKKSGAVDTAEFTASDLNMWERILWQKSLMGIDVP